MPLSFFSVKCNCLFIIGCLLLIAVTLLVIRYHYLLRLTCYSLLLLVYLNVLLVMCYLFQLLFFLPVTCLVLFILIYSIVVTLYLLPVTFYILIITVDLLLASTCLWLTIFCWPLVSLYLFFVPYSFLELLLAIIYMLPLTGCVFLASFVTLSLKNWYLFSSVYEFVNWKSCKSSGRLFCNNNVLFQIFWISFALVVVKALPNQTKEEPKHTPKMHTGLLKILFKEI